MDQDALRGFLRVNKREGQLGPDGTRSLHGVGRLLDHCCKPNCEVLMLF